MLHKALRLALEVYGGKNSPTEAPNQGPDELDGNLIRPPAD